MFRIDRRFVKLTGTRATRTNVSKNSGAGAKGENPDTAASAEDAKISKDETEQFNQEQERASGDITGEEIKDEDNPADIEDTEEPEDTRQNEPKACSEEDILASAEDMARMYMSAAEREMEERSREILDEARADAAKILEDAQAQAEEILETAREEAAQMCSEAKEKGFEEGKSEGLAEGEREGRLNYDEKLSRQQLENEIALKNVLGEIAREQERIETEIEDNTAQLAIEIVRKIFNPAQETLDDVFILLIKNALRQMSTDSKFTIRVSPGEYERFFSSGAAEIVLDSGVTVKAAVLRDITLEEADLIIDTEDVTVNAGLNSQLQYVKLAFERANQFEPEVTIS